MKVQEKHVLASDYDEEMNFLMSLAQDMIHGKPFEDSLYVYYFDEVVVTYGDGSDFIKDKSLQSSSVAYKYVPFAGGKEAIYHEGTPALVLFHHSKPWLLLRACKNYLESKGFPNVIMDGNDLEVNGAKISGAGIINAGNGGIMEAIHFDFNWDNSLKQYLPSKSQEREIIGVNQLTRKEVDPGLGIKELIPFIEAELKQ